MAFESLEQGMRQLFSNTKESEEGIYQFAEAVTGGDLMSLYQSLRLKLTSDGHAANIGETVESSVKKGGGVGESMEQELLKTGTTGWT